MTRWSAITRTRGRRSALAYGSRSTTAAEDNLNRLVHHERGRYCGGKRALYRALLPPLVAQLTAAVLACLRGFSRLSICDRLPPVATTGLFLKKGGVSSQRCSVTSDLCSRTVGCSSRSWRLVCTPCRCELSRLLNSITGRQAAKAKRELAGTESPAVDLGAGLKGWLRESMCQTAIRILRATAALAELL